MSWMYLITEEKNPNLSNQWKWKRSVSKWGLVIGECDNNFLYFHIQQVTQHMGKLGENVYEPLVSSCLLSFWGKLNAYGSVEKALIVALHATGLGGGGSPSEIESNSPCV